MLRGERRNDSTGGAHKVLDYACVAFDNSAGERVWEALLLGFKKRFGVLE